MTSRATRNGVDRDQDAPPFGYSIDSIRPVFSDWAAGHLSRTSVDNANFTVGSQATQFLLQRLEQPIAEQKVYLYLPALSIRRSTARPW